MLGGWIVLVALLLLPARESKMVNCRSGGTMREPVQRWRVPLPPLGSWDCSRSRQELLAPGRSALPSPFSLVVTMMERVCLMKKLLGLRQQEAVVRRGDIGRIQQD